MLLGKRHNEEERGSFVQHQEGSSGNIIDCRSNVGPKNRLINRRRGWYKIIGNLHLLLQRLAW